MDIGARILATGTIPMFHGVWRLVRESQDRAGCGYKGQYERMKGADGQIC